jgi:hypothetical protein
MTNQTLTITTRKSDGAIGVKINGRSVVTITKSGKRARIVGRNLKDIPRGTHRGANRYQFDL